MRKSIYLDHAAATPLDPQVLTAMMPFMTDLFFNPSATYLSAKKVNQAVGDARQDIAQWLGCRPSEIVFTAGGTEANNLAIHGIMRQYPDANIVVSSTEHDAVLAPARKYPCHEVVVQPDGIIDLQALKAAIDESTVLVSIIYANNEIGTVQPLRQIAELIRAVRDQRKRSGSTLPLLFHTDACQAANYLDIHVSRLGVDMMTLNAGKIYGPKQTGLLYIRAGMSLQPQILGGGQERGMRSGTESAANIIGFAAALNRVQQKRKAESDRLLVLRNECIADLTKLSDLITVNGSLKRRLPNNIHLTIKGQDNERLVMALDEKGIECAVGSACSASKTEPSHVLQAIGLSVAEARSSLRVSLGQSTTAEQLRKLIGALEEIIS